MKIGNRVYYFKNGEMKLLSNVEQIYDIHSFRKPIIKWYRRNPYAKRINKTWICKDYRIDQQRPKRNVYSEAYLKIIDITEIEERYLSNLINDLESKINYPKVISDDGENYKIVYEEKVKKHNNDKKRIKKDYSNKKQCHRCKEWINEDDKYCIYCGVKQLKVVECVKCGKKNKVSNKYCSNCGDKL